MSKTEPRILRRSSIDGDVRCFASFIVERVRRSIEQAATDGSRTCDPATPWRRMKNSSKPLPRLLRDSSEVYARVLMAGKGRNIEPEARSVYVKMRVVDRAGFVSSWPGCHCPPGGADSDTSDWEAVNFHCSRHANGEINCGYLTQNVRPALAPAWRNPCAGLNYIME